MSADRAPRALMVIVPDRLSELAEKGEVTRRYYNPGDLFDEVDLVLVNDDRPDPRADCADGGKRRASPTQPRAAVLQAHARLAAAAAAQLGEAGP